MIHWDLLLQTDKVKEELEKLYAEMSLNALAEHLGVSRDSLRRKLVELNISLRSRGGPHYRYPREALPEDAANMSSAQLASLTGYSVRYARKLIRQMKEERK